jgi:hypothetical protein
MTKRQRLNLTRLAVMAGLLLLVSCKKNYTCSCLQTVTVPAYTNGGQYYPEQITMNTVTNTFKSTKKDSESGCKMGESVNSYPSPYAAIGQGPTLEIVTCELK